MHKIPPGSRFPNLNRMASNAKGLLKRDDMQKTIKHLQNKTGLPIQNLDNSINTKSLKEMIAPIEINVMPDKPVHIEAGHADLGSCFVALTRENGETVVIKYNALMLPSDHLDKPGEEIPNFTEKFGPNCSVTVFWNTPKEMFGIDANRKLLQSVIKNNEGLTINMCESGIKGEMKDQPDILVKPGFVDPTTKKVIPPQVFFITPDKEPNPEATVERLTREFANQETE